MNKIAVAVALWFAAGASYAGFVDNRQTDTVIEVSYKSISVEDLAADIVPAEFQISYARPDLRKKVLRITGKGTWQQLLTQAATSSNVLINVDQVARCIQIAERASAQVPAGASSATVASPAAPAAAAGPTNAAKPAVLSSAASPAAPTAAPAPAAAAPAPAALAVPAKPMQTWTVTVADKSVRALLERWAKTAGYQLAWEIPVDLELNANATLAGTFEEALTAVLASLKNSEYPIEAMVYDNKVVRMVKRTPRNK